MFVVSERRCSADCKYGCCTCKVKCRYYWESRGCRCRVCCECDRRGFAKCYQTLVRGQEADSRADFDGEVPSSSRDSSSLSPRPLCSAKSAHSLRYRDYRRDLRLRHRYFLSTLLMQSHRDPRLAYDAAGKKPCTAACAG